MSTQHAWESLGYRNPDFARLLDATFRQRRRLAAMYPWVPVPQCRIGSPYVQGVYPVGALIRMWSCWDQVRGRCPVCGGPVLGFAFAGGLSAGSVTGVCRRCATVVSRWIWGLGTIMEGIRPALSGTPFSVSGDRTRMGHYAPVALVAALQELGETDLPSPRAEGFLSYDPRRKSA